MGIFFNKPKLKSPKGPPPPKPPAPKPPTNNASKGAKNIPFGSGDTEGGSANEY